MQTHSTIEHPLKPVRSWGFEVCVRVEGRLVPVHTWGSFVGDHLAVTDTAHSADITWDSGIHYRPTWIGGDTELLVAGSPLSFLGCPQPTQAANEEEALPEPPTDLHSRTAATLPIGSAGPAYALNTPQWSLYEWVPLRPGQFQLLMGTVSLNFNSLKTEGQ